MRRAFKMFLILSLILGFNENSSSVFSTSVETDHVMPAYLIPHQVLDEGGGMWLSTSHYMFSSSHGQSITGFQSSASYNMYTGFWNPWVVETSAGFSYLCGDANSDGVINVTDVLYLINYLYKNGPSPNPLQAGDVNLDGVVNVSDVLFLINYLYKGGPNPCDVKMTHPKPITL